MPIPEPSTDTHALAGDLSDLALEAATEAAWRQWAVLGSTGLVDRDSGDCEREATILDPEALLLASLALLPHEQRLGDFLAWWAETGAALLSVQRTRTLLTSMPAALVDDEPVAEALAAFAASAGAAGDRRWRRYAGETPLEGRPGKGAERPVLTAPAALLLRLRAGFGVSAKADLLAVLLGLEGRPATVKALAEATGYSTVAVRAALEEMALARFVAATGDYPAAYVVREAERWGALLFPETGSSPASSTPAWGYWAPVYGFLLDVVVWGRRAGGWSVYVASSRARDLLERRGPSLRPIGLDLPEARPGAEYLHVFDRAARAVVDWAYRHA